MTSPSGPLDGVRVAVLNWRDVGSPDAGGAEVYAEQVASGLAERGAAVTFVTSRGPGQPREERRGAVLHRRRGSRLSSYLFGPAYLLTHRRALDVVLDCQNGLAYWAPLFVRRSALCVLVVHHVHEEQWAIHYPKPVAAVGRAVERWTARRVYRGRPVVAVSSSTAADVRDRLGHTGPVVTAFNGAPALGPVAAQRDSRPRLVYVGRLAKHKRVDRLVLATAELATQRPDLRLDVVGTGSELAPLRRLVGARGLEETVRLHGWVPDEERNRLLQRAWVHVQPSRGEGWGLTVVEAAAAGVPSVVYPVPGLRESVADGSTGWHVRPGESLADALRRALGEVGDVDRRRELAEACRAWSQQHSWSATVDRFAELVSAHRSRDG